MAFFATVILTAVLWCFDVTPLRALHSASKRKSERAQERKSESARARARGRERERKSESESESERARARAREWFGEHLLRPTLCIKPFVLLLIRCPRGTTLLDMVGMDHIAVGMDVDVAAGVECQEYAPMSSGSAKSAALETGGVVRFADTVRVSGTTRRIFRSRELRKKLMSWRRRWLVLTTTSLF